MKPASAAAALLGGFALHAGVAATGLAPVELLDRMSEAVRTLDYEGRLVMQSGDRLEALYVVHRMDSGSEKERVVSLTGEPREIIRSDEAVACLVPGRDQKINVGRRPGDQMFSPLHGIGSDHLARSYRISMLGSDRVAGREAHQLLIEPRDDLRYGYRLFIDRESALPLRTVTFDDAQRPVSQMMFVELKVGESVTPIEHDLSAMQRARVDEPHVMPLERLAPPSWRFNALPPGFQLDVHRRKAGGRGEREHFIFSDGLATVSVYVQQSDGKGLSGASRLGAAQAVGREIDGHDVVVVGEVPLKTLQLFASHIQAAGR